MKTYCIAVAAAITLIFASAADASQRHDDDRKRDGYSQHGKRGKEESRDRSRHDRQERHVKQERHERHERHDKRDHRKDYAHQDRRDHNKRDYHKDNRHHPKPHRPVERHVYHHDKHHHSHSDVNWLINLDLTPYARAHRYSDGHYIYYQRRAGGRCYRVEERYDRTVWIDVPFYKCR